MQCHDLHISGHSVQLCCSAMHGALTPMCKNKSSRELHTTKSYLNTLRGCVVKWEIRSSTEFRGVQHGAMSSLTKLLVVSIRLGCHDLHISGHSAQLCCSAMNGALAPVCKNRSSRELHTTKSYLNTLRGCVVKREIWSSTKLRGV